MKAKRKIKIMLNGCVAGTNFVLIVFAVCITISRFGDMGALDNAISAISVVVEILALVGVFTTLRTEKELKKQEYIKDYSFEFLSSPSLFGVERMLESCHSIYCRYDDAGGRLSEIYIACSKIMSVVKEESDEGISKEHHELVGYLVYMESLAPLIINRQIPLDDIDDLFGYRYFTTMNNPIVQEVELVPYADYYQGCLKMYPIWMRYRKKKNRVIPMNRFAPKVYMSQTSDASGKGMRKKQTTWRCEALWNEDVENADGSGHEEKSEPS